jgi:hypothetical protein
MKAQKGGGLFGDYYTNYTMENGVNSGILQYVYYFILLTILLIFVLTLVHFTVYPIFKTRPGGDGIISVPGADDAKLFWKDAKDIRTVTQEESIGNITENWSFLLDIQVDNPTANTNHPRVLMYRGPSVQEPATTLVYGESSTILNIVPNFNTIVYLDRLTNDLNISILLTTNANESAMIENIIIPNIPVRKAVRVGVMIGSRVMEVYINGYLAKSKTYTRSPKEITGGIQPPFANILDSTATVGNLRLWNRTLSPAEFRSFGLPTDFAMKDIPDSPTCNTS